MDTLQTGLSWTPSTMVMPVLVVVFLWISFVLPPATSQDCKSTMLSPTSIHFEKTSRSWCWAERGCRARNGELLQVLDCVVQEAIQKEKRVNSYALVHWWVGQNLRNDSSAPNLTASGKPFHLQAGGSYWGNKGNPYFCTYITSNYQLGTTSDCGNQKWSICVIDPSNPRNKRTAEADFNGYNRKRRKRALDSNPPIDVSATLINMTKSLGNIYAAVQQAVDFLQLMEQGRINPTFKETNVFLQFLLNVSLSEASLPWENKTTVTSLLFNCTGAVLYFATSYCGGNQFSRSQLADISGLVLRIYQVLSLQVNSEPTTTIETSVAIIHTTRLTPKQLAGSIIKVPGTEVSVRLPSFSTLGPLLEQYTNITVELVNFKVNPYPDDQGENITGSVCSLTLTSDLDEIHLDNLQEVVEFFLPRPDAPAIALEGVSVQEDTLVTTSFNITDQAHTIILTMNPSENVSLHLQLTYETPPNGSNILNSTVLDSTVGYRWLITPEMLWSGNGTWYVQARVLKPSSGLNITLEVSAFPSKCIFWNESLEAWSTMGCLVGLQSELNLTHCLCNHLTTFASSIFVMPNRIDLSRTAEYFATVKENYVVPVLLLAFFAVYLVALVWACFADRQTSRKRKITWLGDSTFCAQYSYLLSVHTGHRSRAGTSAQVEMALVGTEGETDTHPLLDPDKPLFERGSVDMFLLTTPFSLGELQSVSVSHDNSGGQPSWYLSKMMIQDLQTRQQWHFLCSAWLSSAKGDGMTKRTFHVAPKSQITSFGNIFQSRTSTGFRDEHIWVSVVDPPRRSPFTRAQRVSCCMCLLLCTMAINIMFWNVPANKDSPVIFSVGSLKLTLEELMVGIESGLLMFPINILIITIFRSTKPRHSPAKDTNDSVQEKKAPPVTMLSFLKDTEKFITSLSKCPRNKVAALENPLEMWSDLFPALDRVQGLLQLMQAEKETDLHWVFCSQFVFFSLRRLAEAMDRLDVKAFQVEKNYWKAHSTVTHLLKEADMVANSHMQKGPSISVPESEKKKGCWLPWWFVFIGWFLLLSISGVSTFFTLLYGFVYGKESSTKWVITLGLSLFQSIFVLQPLKVLGVAIFFALTLKTMVVDDSDEAEYLLEEQRKKNALLTGRTSP